MAKIIDIIQTFNVRIALKNIYSKIDEIIRKVNESPEPTYKVYSALLAQSGEDAPTATVLENTLGGDIIWERITDGEYSGTLTDAFTLNKSWSTYPTISGQDSTILVDFLDVNTFYISTFSSGVAADNLLDNASIEIRVYN